MSADESPLRTAEIIAVGSELLGSTRLDTNSLFLSERLESLGIELRAKAVVGDSRGDLATIFRQALDRADVVVLTGGLGPTDDDVTRDVVASVLDLPFTEDPSIVEWISQRFSRRGLRMPEVNRRQAMVPRGATALDNPNGTAPGLLIEHGGKVVVLLPGPPRELQPMFEKLVAGRLGARSGRERIYRTVLLTTGRGESHIEEAIQPIYSMWRSARPPIETTILATPGQIEVHLSLRSDDPVKAEQTLTSAREALIAALGDSVFSLDGRPMEQILGELLRDRGLTISAAESCTGGLFLSRLTDVPGSSAYVLSGVVAYSNRAKTEFLGVSPDLIAAHGAVSEPVAVAMADGIRERTGASFGVGITGIAGPDGGTPEKPVGTVAIAVAGPGGPVKVRTVLLAGSRSMVKLWATQAAMDMVRKMIVRDEAVRRS
jgi:competence/damage-inducible protein CinA-like protein